jgi:hypothetical protein
VVSETADFHIVFVNADDTLDNADRNSGLVEIPTLLNMQLEVAMKPSRGDARIGQARRISSNSAYSVRQ